MPWEAFLWGIASALSLPLGAVTSFFWRPQDRMIAQTMLPEAYFKGGSLVGFATLLGFLSAGFFKTLEPAGPAASHAGGEPRRPAAVAPAEPGAAHEKDRLPVQSGGLTRARGYPPGGTPVPNALPAEAGSPGCGETH